MSQEGNNVKIYRCMIDVIIPRRHRKSLIDAMRHAPFALRHHVDLQAVESSIRSGRLRVQYLREEPWVGFESDIGLLSYYLKHHLVRGISVVEQHKGDGSQVLTAEKIVGRRGETVRIPLLAQVRDDGVHVDADHEDLVALREHWQSYPLWVQDAVRVKYPVVRSW